MGRSLLRGGAPGECWLTEAVISGGSRVRGLACLDMSISRSRQVVPLLPYGVHELRRKTATRRLLHQPGLGRGIFSLVFKYELYSYYVPPLVSPPVSALLSY